MDHSDFLDSLRCPISLNLFLYPVILGSTGQSFEKLEIETWLQHNNTNPLTNEPILSENDRELIPNYSLRQSVEYYVQSILGEILTANELKVNEKLNEGSQKIVFRAVYHGKIVVVLKFFQVILTEDESRIFVRLGCHPHLLGFVGRACLSQSNEVVNGEPNAIVTEYAPLDDLSSYFRGLADSEESLTLVHKLLIAEQVAKGMTAVHAAGIIHGYLAARNVMVFAMDVNSPNRTVVKVGDYGIATFTGEHSYVQTAGTNTISLSRWMSPEALRFRRWSKQSDVWSFGVLLWEILTQGAIPYDYLDDAEAGRRVDQEGLRLPKPTACPNDVWQLVERCFAIQPKDRPSFIEMKENLISLRSQYCQLTLRAQPPNAIPITSIPPSSSIPLSPTEILASSVPLPPSAPPVTSSSDYKISKLIIRNSCYDLKNFNGLRTPDDFAKGFIFNKTSVKDKFLIWQSSVIPKSLMVLTKEHSKVAVQIHKDLLGFMGDKHMPLPAMLPKDVLEKGIESPVFRDEIYSQIIKQLSSNPSQESVAKGWQMMCMCVRTFPPSKPFENFLLHFILDNLEKGCDEVVNYSKYCFRILEVTTASVVSLETVPTVEEILTYRERPPMLATILLVDNKIVTEDLPVTPYENVGNVIMICSGWLELNDPRANTIGLFVYDMGEIVDPVLQSRIPSPYAALIRTPRPLRNDEYLGDVIVQMARQKRNFKLVLKKKIFSPHHNYYGNDPYYEHLVYLQCEDEVIVQGNIPITDEALGLRLASISMAVALGDSMPHTVQGLLDENLLDFFPPILRDTLPPEEWAERVLQQRLNCILANPEDMQKEFVHSIQQNPLYGMHWFYVYKGNNQPAMIAHFPKELILGFNSEGVHVFNLNRVRLHSFVYKDITRWGGNSSQFSLKVLDSEIKETFDFTVLTGQTLDLCAIILDQIHAIMQQH